MAEKHMQHSFGLLDKDLSKILNVKIFNDIFYLFLDSGLLVNECFCTFLFRLKIKSDRKLLKIQFVFNV